MNVIIIMNSIASKVYSYAENYILFRKLNDIYKDIYPKILSSNEKEVELYGRLQSPNCIFELRMPSELVYDKNIDYKVLSDIYEEERTEYSDRCPSEY